MPLVNSPRYAKQLFLVILDFLAFPVLIWFCYALREFNLGAEVVPNIAYGSLWVSTLAVAMSLICGLYHFIVRTFNEVFLRV
jgi:hypothetical protein